MPSTSPSGEPVFMVPTGVAKPVNYSSAQTGTAVWTPATGKRVALYGYMFTKDTAGTSRLIVGTSSTLIVPHTYIPANGTVGVPAGSVPIWVGAVDQVVGYTSVGGGNESVLIWGYEI